MGITPLALLLDELKLLEDLIEELLEDLIEELLDDGTILLDEETTELDELLFTELELGDELETGHPPTMPNGEGWLTQVATEIQLLLFS